MAAPRIITLTTDFGLSDHFVGVMKGVMLGIAPGARIVDISHEITPFQIREAGFLVAQFNRYFPPRTIHVAVVDPGVGTMRRPILVEAEGQYFVGPDNGLFSMILARGPARVRALTAAKYFLKPVSDTFHGRDIFAPVAARLASGTPPSRFGRLIDDPMRSSFGKPVQTGKRIFTGEVMKVDRFGNLITNFHIEDFGGVTQRPFELAVGAECLTCLAPTFAEIPANAAGVVIGSSGYLEVAANQKSAARMLGCGPGSPVELTLY